MAPRQSLPVTALLTAWLATAQPAAALLEPHPFSQLLPSPLQHSTTLREVIRNAAASGAALAIARYGSRLLTTPYIITAAAET